MNRLEKKLSLVCQSCEGRWDLDRTVSHHERETLEAKPCPQCGAMTLVCREVKTRPNVAWRFIRAHNLQTQIS